MSAQMKQSSSPHKAKKVLPVGHYRGLGAWTAFFLHLSVSSHHRADLLFVQRQPHGHELGRVRL